jgi:hypothetical protein
MKRTNSEDPQQAPVSACFDCDRFIAIFSASLPLAAFLAVTCENCYDTLPSASLHDTRHEPLWICFIS